FKKGITGIRFAEHQRCYIRTQTKKLPTVAEAEADDRLQPVDEAEAVEVQVEDSRVWVPAEEPVVNPDFLLDSKIWEICQQMPIHWIHPSPMTGQRFARDVLDHAPVNDYNIRSAHLHFTDLGSGATPARSARSQSGIIGNPSGAPACLEERRSGCVIPTRMCHALKVKREVGIELDNRLDERGYCCQYCRRGYRFCRRYFEPLGGFNPWPYYYQGGRVICQVVMPCDWWVARMLGRI
uniref:Tenomodulin n=1 Tax=Poecilia formosa TaxID=48698 RepID=A0A096LUB7_POEFO